MSRFNSRAHLNRWATTGQYPTIHDPIWHLIRASVTPTEAGTVCDLAASTGLLTHRLNNSGYQAYGLDANHEAVTTASHYGTGPVEHFTVTPDTLADLAALLTERHTRTVVARRTLPELHDAGVTPGMLSDVLRYANIQHLFIEGRQPRAAATHPLSTLRHELDALTGWAPATVDKHTAHLRPT